ncbi:polysaccharide export outer membrane protein [Yoonia tamlensis]|uniref:Polysaccharide export outer membrane protein n=1 Tax=Yoonia tamlensis TaxID=390270 RepID=A0A1I6HF67_9RHOB|nr:polysaccharide biosynthesis/export family protein [Yoonia tamlensis]SFR53123.1 polysaccharide export outer membrane protein [Yoonia tamlensis]
MILRKALLYCALLAATGCGGLPAFGPSAQEITNAAVTVAAQDDDMTTFALVEVSAQTVPPVQQGGGAFTAHFRAQRFLTEDEPISVSDLLEIRIWEAASDGLFSTSGQRDTVLTIPVSNAGTITVPYAGGINVAGLTTDRVRGVLLAKYNGQAIDPEISVQIVETATRTVAVLGAVRNSGRAEIPAQGMRLLDLLAQMGGVSHPDWEVEISVARGAQRSKLRMDHLAAQGGNNIVILPNDTVQVTHAPRRYAVFGAVAQSGRVSLDVAKPTLSDLLAEVGGLNDMQAAPNAVFVFRRAMRPDEQPTVYKLDFARADSFLLADQFVLRDTDIVYVATADAREFQKFISTLVSPLLGGVSSVQNLGN